MIYNKVLVTAVSTHGEQLVRVWRIIVDHHWAASLSGRRSLGPHIEIDCAALKRRAGQAQRTQLLLASEGARGRPSFDKCRQEMSAGATGSLLWRGVGLATVVQDVRESLPLLLWGSLRTLYGRNRTTFHLRCLIMPEMEGVRSIFFAIFLTTSKSPVFYFSIWYHISFLLLHLLPPVVKRSIHRIPCRIVSSLVFCGTVLWRAGWCEGRRGWKCWPSRTKATADVTGGHKREGSQFKIV